MRLYFAFGANMDVAGMSRRCPTAEAVGTARLENHRFAIVHPGFATVIAATGATVHGVLWRLDSRDLNVLDAYENIASGLYGRAEKPVRHGTRTLRALTYFVRRAEVGSSEARLPRRLRAAGRAALGIARGVCSIDRGLRGFARLAGPVERDEAGLAPDAFVGARSSLSRRSSPTTARGHISRR